MHSSDRSLQVPDTPSTPLSPAQRIPASHDGQKPPRRSPGRLVGVVALLLVIAGGWRWWAGRPAAKDKAGGTPSSIGAARPALPPVPVVAGTVSIRDVPIYLDGLGTVQAFNSVTVRPRVDGLLSKVEFTEGQEVKQGDRLAQIDPEPFRIQLQQAEARKRQDEAQLANARAELRREATLLADKIDSQEAYDTQAAQVDQLVATVAADQAAIETAKLQLEWTTVTSPISGRTGIRLVDQGNLVHAGDSNGLVVITQQRPISVVFTLPEQALGQLQAHGVVSDFPVLAVDRDNRTVLDSGRLAVIDNQIDSSTGTIKLKATFANEQLRLWPGQFVNARLLVTTRKDGLVLPAAAVQRGPEGTFVFVIKEDQSVAIRPVKVARIADGEALLDGGVKAGESVVVDGQYRLQAGSRIRLATSTNSFSGSERTSPAGAPKKEAGAPPRSAP
jgi:multidrug efflux system membrane fusion protein